MPVKEKVFLEGFTWRCSTKPLAEYGTCFLSMWQIDVSNILQMAIIAFLCHLRALILL